LFCFIRLSFLTFFLHSIHFPLLSSDFRFHLSLPLFSLSWIELHLFLL
jgi:hypothetical protein